MALLTCPCGVTNRVPSNPTSKVKCGKCGRVFTPWELVKARHEPPPERPKVPDGFSLNSDDDTKSEEQLIREMMRGGVGFDFDDDGS